jgi:DNA-binding cell septation regulator SpoVG
MEFVKVFVQVPLDLQFIVGSSAVVSPARGIFVSLLTQVGELVQSM